MYAHTITLLSLAIHISDHFLSDDNFKKSVFFLFFLYLCLYYFSFEFFILCFECQIQIAFHLYHWEYRNILNVCVTFSAVHEACKEVFRSRKLKRLLELVLACGNYMNRGQRGNALGFHPASLNKMVDTRSSISKQITLLHYVVSTLEKKVKLLT